MEPVLPLAHYSLFLFAIRNKVPSFRTEV